MLGFGSVSNVNHSLIEIGLITMDKKTNKIKILSKIYKPST